MKSLSNAAAVAGAVALLSAMPIGSANAAGLFDFLFGGFAQPTQPSWGGAEPLGVRVNPRHRIKVREPHRAVSSSSSRTALSKPKIDPVTNPNWYLEDPTLRRGDIVVLPTRVLVYEGGRGQATPADFTSLSKSHLVSKTVRDKIMIARTWREDDPPPPAKPATPPKEAALSQP